MQRASSVVVLGGGLAGIATAYSLARAGRRVTLVERGATLGGLAGSFTAAGHVYPLGYHHILHRDRTLLYFLHHVGALPRVKWRRVKMLLEGDGRRFYDLADPLDFARFPLPLADKLRFVRLMLTAFTRPDWRDWEQRSAAELIDEMASPRVRAVLFEPLTQLKFQLSCAEVSAAWVGARLHYREGSAPLGYIPDTNWTTVLCDGLTELIARAGVTVHTGQAVTRLHAEGQRLREAELADGTRVAGELFVSALPVPVYLQLAPEESDPALRAISYSALLSAICATDQPLPRRFYWLNLTSLRHTACAIFALDALNPSIGAPGETCLNFVTHLTRGDPLFGESDDAILGRYHDDFFAVFGRALEAKWTRLTRIPAYSPVFDVAYRNPPMRSARYENLFFTGTYRTYPSVASTGTALQSGLETATAILARSAERNGVVEEMRRHQRETARRA